MVYFNSKTKLPPFLPLPHFVLDGKYSLNAKLLYGMLLNRAMLSRHNRWVTEDGRVFVIYTIKQLAIDLHRSERTVKTALKELDEARLIVRVHQGSCKPDHIFVLVPDEAQDPAASRGNICPTERQEFIAEKCNICTVEGQESALAAGQNVPTSNTDYSNNYYNNNSKNKKSERRHEKYTYEGKGYI